MVDEPSEAEALVCLHGLRPRYEDFHGVTLTDAALKAAVTYAKRWAGHRARAWTLGLQPEPWS